MSEGKIQTSERSEFVCILTERVIMRLCRNNHKMRTRNYKNAGFTPSNNFVKNKIAAKRHLTGFTLIELLVVISIIGVLSSIVLVSFSDVRENARNTKRKTDVRQIMTAMELYLNENKVYITSSNNLCKDDSIGNFLTAVPEDPLSNTTTQKCYTWVDNTAPACDYKFCVYADLEGGAGYFAASHKGVKKLGAAPVAGFCDCW
jgi:prepilin-type N-terminal cleavage/methylation domain-containing protein